MIVQYKVAKLRKLNRVVDASSPTGYDWEPANRLIEYEDVKRFLTAKNNASYEGLLKDFSYPIDPLFGYSRQYIDENGEVFIDEDRYDLTEISDIQNISALLKAGMKLAQLARTPHVDERVSKGKLFLIEELNSPYRRVTIKILILGSDETLEFLKRSLPHSIFSLEEYMPRSRRGAKSQYQLIGEVIIDECSMSSWEDACAVMFDKLSELMLSNVSLHIRQGEIAVDSESIASSLWVALLEKIRKNEIRSCMICGDPMLAAPKRRYEKLYCSDACNKYHQRLIKFKSFKDYGYTDKAAASEAKVSLQAAQEYWSTHSK